MRKIPTLFKRDPEIRLVTQEITEGCEWVINNPEDVIVTRKWDGTACLIKNNEIWKRYDCKKGKKPPAGFIPCQEPDEITGHWPGWVKCDPNNPDDKYHFEGLLTWYKNTFDALGYYDPFVLIPNGTYELIGEKIQGNPERIEGHNLIYHTSMSNMIEPNIVGLELTCDGIKNFLYKRDIEGLVFYYRSLDTLSTPMCKIKKKDFGFKR